MSRNFCRGLLVVVVGTGVVFFYRTNAPPAEPAAPTAEFGGVSLRIEYATTTAARERGLGGRTNIPNDYGMLFVFTNDDIYGFWMKDMLVPIDIFWLNSDGHVVSIMKDIAISTYPNVLYPSASARYVLETAAGFAKANNIAIGTSLLLKNLPSVTQ